MAECAEKPAKSGFGHCPCWRPRGFADRGLHRSCIVNLEKVTKVEPYSKDNHMVVLGNGTQLPGSRSGYPRLRKFSRPDAGEVGLVSQAGVSALALQFVEEEAHQHPVVADTAQSFQLR
jgi:hypothetical protein